jgi:hypothetical protein
MGAISIGVLVLSGIALVTVLVLYRQATHICEGHGSIRMQLVKDWDRLDRCGRCGHRLPTGDNAPVRTLRSGIRNWGPELLGR